MNNLNNLNEYKNWLIKRNLSEKTVLTRSWCLRTYGKRELNTDEIVKFFKEKLTRYGPHSLQSFRKALTSYSKFEKITIEWELINKLIPTVQQKFFPTINEIELEKLKQSVAKTKLVTNQRNSLILDFFFYTGIRVGELVNIRHCDYQNNSLKIHGKGNKIRYIPILGSLARHFNGSSDYLFKTWKGKAMSEQAVWKMISQKSKRIGLDKCITPHTFRRSFATLLNSRKCNLTAIQKFLGHSNLQTTANYIHNSYEELRQEYSKLWISSPPPPHTHTHTHTHASLI